MKWCCVQFQSYIEYAGRRGLAIIVEASNQSDPRFTIQFRATDVDDEPPRFAEGYNGPLSLSTETGIQFCPWCGKFLKKWYGRRVSKFSRPDLLIRFEE